MNRTKKHLNHALDYLWAAEDTYERGSAEWWEIHRIAGELESLIRKTGDSDE